MTGINLNTFPILLILGIIVIILCDLPTTQAKKTSKYKKRGTNQKLLIIMLDGFRWDYYDRQKDELPAFSKFLNKGVQAKWVEHVFPSTSYPSWTTITTGVYPEVHGILNNFMFDEQNGNVFDYKNDTSVKMEQWWQNVEPLWITATQNGHKVLLHRWARCDVPFNGVKPENCSTYNDAAADKETDPTLLDTLRIAVESLQQDYGLAMVYSGIIDDIGLEFGPNSTEMMDAVLQVDETLSIFLNDTENPDFENKVNTIIIGDHGMKTLGESAKYVKLSDYISACDIYKIVGRGTVVAIVPQALKGQEGFDVYFREDIPEQFHYKNGKLVLDLLLVAQPNYYIWGLDGEKQIPENSANNVSDIVIAGTHGYPYMAEMRTIFFAKGPGFKRGIVHSPIELVDLYQIFTYLLDIPTKPNNGSWERISNIFSSSSSATFGVSNNFVIIVFTLSTYLIKLISFIQ